ncbi:MAG: FAD-binding oxidoreductase [Alphaproteobacteria bacterium]|nr:FAD-binding oxidoreductase [Alphaproteobacteria bacterium]
MSDIINRLGRIVGQNNCLSGDDLREKYDHDITGVYKGRSLAVVRPASTDEVSQILALAFETGTAVVPLGGNTGLAGGGFAGAAGDKIILSLERMNKIVAINRQSRLARVEAGVVLANLHAAVEEVDLVFPLVFGARGSCMIGGNLSTNAGGSNVVRYGNTRALCLGLEVVMADGEIVNLMSELHKDNTGYDLKDLFIGAEGTLGVITGAVLKLYEKPKAYATAMVSVKDIPTALDLLHKLQAVSGGAVEAFEYMPKNYFRHLQMVDANAPMPFDTLADTAVLVEIATTNAQSATAGPDGKIPLVALLEDTLFGLLEVGQVLDATIAQSQSQRAEMWRQREMAFEVATHLGVSITADVAVPLDKVDTFLTEMEARIGTVAPKAEIVVISHLGDGNLHYSLWVDPDNPGQVDDAQKTAIYNLVEDVVEELEGSFSAEHGIGLAKLGSMARRKDKPALAVMRQIKRALDSKNIMNPGKMLP